MTTRSFAGPVAELAISLILAAAAAGRATDYLLGSHEIPPIEPVAFGEISAWAALFAVVAVVLAAASSLAAWTLFHNGHMRQCSLLLAHAIAAAVYVAFSAAMLSEAIPAADHAPALRLVILPLSMAALHLVRWRTCLEEIRRSLAWALILKEEPWSTGKP